MELAPEYVQNMFVTEKRHSFDNKAANNNGDSFMVEDLLDFSNDDGDAVIADSCGGVAAFDTFTGNSTDSSTLTVIDTSSNSSSGEPANFAADFGTRNNFNEVPFSSDLCVPYDDLAELEWQLSSFSEESFSTEDLHKLQLISGIKARPDAAAPHTRQLQPDSNHNNLSNNNNPIFNSDISVPAKARSKRSRAAPCNWTSRLLLLSPTSESSPEPSDATVVSEHPPPQMMTPASSAGKKSLKTPAKKKENLEGGGGDGRKCLHCATDKTPQWRTGPMGPKTLCNACGVRYKSGRLVPEYRPAASPTFVLTKHSNSHRKVLELRRQKEMGRGVQNHHQSCLHHQHHQPPQQQQQHHHHHHHHNPNMMFDVNGGDYLIHQHVGTDFRQLI